MKCYFGQEFFQPFGALNRYAVLQPGRMPVFELSDDLLRGLVFELLHFALKMYPGSSMDKHSINAAK
jgi:AraC family transcriptional regulator, transcriptional activator of pobA